ncbi:hypothetical protein OPKNFCMD_3425 [Methylobacterium crusticola]|uniref:Uncharacterized protein n=1 Tax=Methylobacterium crusticola TaxID=1697972 RepID=A0ABQ4R138_9HYPH|nr:hypothetical protein [Methylobacterium crusticola]GJD50680.1 hypothetical protein OPKNFCMD_3425 [Methylobacterium crusticola]
MTVRTPEEARAQIEFAIQAKRSSLETAALALRETPTDPQARRVVTRLTEDVERLEIQLRGTV